MPERIPQKNPKEVLRKRAGEPKVRRSRERALASNNNNNTDQAMSKTKLTATDSFSETFTRTTARDYKFVVITRADQKNVEAARRLLDGYNARLDEIGAEGVERAEEFERKCYELRRAALDAKDFNLARKFCSKADQYSDDARLLLRIERTEQRLIEAQEEADAKTVIGRTWTSRMDLAMKESSKMGQRGTVEIVPVG